MIWKKRRKQLQGPEFVPGQRHEISLTGTRLHFNVTSSAFSDWYTPYPTNYMIYNDETYTTGIDCDPFGLTLYHTGWCFKEKKLIAQTLGCVRLQVFLHRRYNVQPGADSCFSRAGLTDWFIDLKKNCKNQKSTLLKDLISATYSDWLKSKLSPREVFAFLTTPGILRWLNFSSQDWMYYKVILPNQNVTQTFSTAIGDNYVLSMTFIGMGINCQYNDDGHDLGDVVVDTISRFMSTVEVALSPTARKQRALACPTVTAA